MTLLAIELGSLKPEPYLPILQQTLNTIKSKRLYIVILLAPELLMKLDTPAKRVGRFKPLQSLISALYVCTAAKPEVNCDIVFADWCGYSLSEEKWNYSVLSLPESSPNLVTRLPQSRNSVRTVTYLNEPVIEDPSTEISEPEIEHAVVAVGGTFDHLHPGHKILLTLTAYLTSKRLVCGITADALLKNKKYQEYLESISVRTDNVRAFLRMIARHLILDLVPIEDVAGPTATDAEISALVISEETRSGAEFIKKIRMEKGLPDIEVYSIDVIGDTPGKLEEKDMMELKLSSTKIREQLAKRE